MFRTGPQLMFLTLIVGVVLLRESERQPLNAANERFIDFLADNARRSEKAAPVTLVGLDEASLREHPLPWTPGDYALFFNAANNFHPQLVATDEILDWKLDSLYPEVSQTFAQYSQMLRENIRKSPRTVLGAELSFPEDADRIPPLESIAGLRKVKGDVSSIPEFRVIEAQASDELRLASVQGFTTWPVARSSTRTAPLLLRYCGQVVPSFVLQTAMLWEEVTPDDVEVEVGNHIRLGGRVTIPIDAAGRMRVNMTLPIGRCSVEDLLVRAEQKDAKTRTVSRTDVFSSRALVLSRTDANAHLIPVTFDRARPRGELAALALGTIQNRLFIRSVPRWTNWAIIGFFTLAAGFVPGLKRSHVLILGSVAILASLVAALALIGARLIAFPAIVPLGLTLFLIITRFLTPNRAVKTNAPPASTAPSTPPAPSTSPVAASTTTSPPPAIATKQAEAAAPRNPAMN
jgi:CHASE2 domain